MSAKRCSRPASGSASPRAIRAAPTSSSRLARSASSASSRADVAQRAKALREAVEGASAVVNLVGVFGRAMQRVHVDGARNVAEAARGRRAAPLVHISAIGADPESQSDYGRTKGEGEAAVRERLPERDDRPPFAGVRAGGRAHQPLRRQWRGCRSFR